MFVLISLALITVADAQFGLDILNKGGIDLNPAHQLCQPCIFVANTLKNTNKQPSVKEAEKRTCNNVLNNELVCNGAVEVAAIYFNWTPAEKMCETVRMCAHKDNKRKIRSPSDGRPDELAERVLEILESDEFPISLPRFTRRAGFLSELDLKKISDFQKIVQEHSQEINEALQQILARFKKAIQVYTDGTSPSSPHLF